MVVLMFCLPPAKAPLQMKDFLLSILFVDEPHLLLALVFFAEPSFLEEYIDLVCYELMDLFIYLCYFRQARIMLKDLVLINIHFAWL